MGSLNRLCVAESRQRQLAFANGVLFCVNCFLYRLVRYPPRRPQLQTRVYCLLAVGLTIFLPPEGLRLELQTPALELG